MKCDLHIHTRYSFDSSSAPEAVIDTALKRGINCLAITDHSQVKGVMVAQEYARGKPIVIIPGIEIKSRAGDILGLNIKEIIPDGLSAQETVKRIKKSGGMAIIPHPFGFMSSFKRGILIDLIPEIDGIEVLNGALFRKNNEKALRFAQKHNLAFTAGSDAHTTKSVGGVYIEIPGEDLTVEEILVAIREKRGKVEGQEHGLGEKIIEYLKMLVAKLRPSNFPNFRL